MVKILFLHGYGQNPGESFIKSQSLQKLMPGAEFVFPSAPVEIVLPDSHSEVGRTDDKLIGPKMYSWNYPKEHLSINLINLEALLLKLTPILEKQGPFDGIMGFSQGAAAASAIASILSRRLFDVKHPPFRFAVLFCGARPESSFFDPIYHSITTPSLHYIGQQDVMVPTSRSLELADAYHSAMVLYHPGNHFIPQGHAHTSKVVEFIESALCPSTIDSVLEPKLTSEVTQRPQTNLISKSVRKIRTIKRQSSFRVQRCIRA